MKRYATFFLSILLLAALTACGSGSSPSGKDAPPVRTPMGTKDTEQTSDLEQAYSDLVERFRTLVSDPFGQDSDEPGEMGVLETARGMGDDAPYEMGYLIEDLSGDGIPELAVGGLRGMTNALYTLVDGKPELVFEGWYRSSYVYLGDGRFYYYGSNSAAESGQGVFALTKDGTRLECESFLFTGLNSDGDVVVYSNETGSWDIAESEKSDMTAEEFWALDPLGEPLPLIPFSGAEAGGTNGSAFPVSVDYLPEGMLPDYWVTLYDGDGAAFLLFTTDSPVTEFTVLALELKDFTETGAAIFSAAPVVLEEGLDSLPEVMTVDTPVAVQLGFMGTSPITASPMWMKTAISAASPWCRAATMAPSCLMRPTRGRHSSFFRERCPNSEGKIV